MKLITTLLISLLSLSSLAVDTNSTLQRVIITTSQYSREINTNETAAEWREKLGVSEVGLLSDVNTNQFEIQDGQLNLKTNPVVYGGPVIPGATDGYYWTATNASGYGAWRPVAYPTSSNLVASVSTVSNLVLSLSQTTTGIVVTVSAVLGRGEATNIASQLVMASSNALYSTMTQWLQSSTNHYIRNSFDTNTEGVVLGIISDLVNASDTTDPTKMATNSGTAWFATFNYQTNIGPVYAIVPTATNEVARLHEINVLQAQVSSIIGDTNSGMTSIEVSNYIAGGTLNFFGNGNGLTNISTNSITPGFHDFIVDRMDYDYVNTADVNLTNLINSRSAALTNFSLALAQAGTNWTTATSNALYALIGEAGLSQTTVSNLIAGNTLNFAGNGGGLTSLYNLGGQAQDTVIDVKDGGSLKFTNSTTGATLGFFDDAGGLTLGDSLSLPNINSNATPVGVLVTDAAGNVSEGAIPTGGAMDYAALVATNNNIRADTAAWLAASNTALTAFLVNAIVNTNNSIRTDFRAADMALTNLVKFTNDSIIYVDLSRGSDANPGTVMPLPLLTITNALHRARNSTNVTINIMGGRMVADATTNQIHSGGFQDLTIQGNGASLYYTNQQGSGWQFTNFNGLAIRNVNFHGYKTNIAMQELTAAIGIGLLDVTRLNRNLVVENCGFYDWPDQAISPLSNLELSSLKWNLTTDGLIVRNCKFINIGTTNRTSIGLDGACMAGFAAENVLIEGNYASNVTYFVENDITGSQGIITNNHRNWTVRDNKVEALRSIFFARYFDSTKFIPLMKGVVVQNNQVSWRDPDGYNVSGASADGIGLYDAQDVMISGNTFSNHPGNTIVVATYTNQVRNIVVEGNAFYNCVTPFKAYSLNTNAPFYVEDATFSYNHLRSGGSYGSQPIVMGAASSVVRGNVLEKYGDNFYPFVVPVNGMSGFRSVFGRATNVLVSDNTWLSKSSGATLGNLYWVITAGTPTQPISQLRFLNNQDFIGISADKLVLDTFEGSPPTTKIVQHYMVASNTSTNNFNVVSGGTNSFDQIRLTGTPPNTTSAAMLVWDPVTKRIGTNPVSGGGGSMDYTYVDNADVNLTNYTDRLTATTNQPSAWDFEFSFKNIPDTTNQSQIFQVLSNAGFTVATASGVSLYERRLWITNGMLVSPPHDYLDRYSNSPNAIYFVNQDGSGRQWREIDLEWQVDTNWSFGASTVCYAEMFNLSLKHGHLVNGNTSAFTDNKWWLHNNYFTCQTQNDFLTNGLNTAYAGASWVNRQGVYTPGYHFPSIGETYHSGLRVEDNYPVSKAVAYHFDYDAEISTMALTNVVFPGQTNTWWLELLSSTGGASITNRLYTVGIKSIRARSNRVGGGPTYSYRTNGAVIIPESLVVVTNVTVGGNSTTTGTNSASQFRLTGTPSSTTSGSVVVYDPTTGLLGTNPVTSGGGGPIIDIQSYATNTVGAGILLKPPAGGTTNVGLMKVTSDLYVGTGTMPSEGSIRMPDASSIYARNGGGSLELGTAFSGGLYIGSGATDGIRIRGANTYFSVDSTTFDLDSSGNLWATGVTTSTNGYNIPITLTAPNASGPTNGVARIWNSNGIPFIRVSTSGTNEGVDYVLTGGGGSYTLPSFVLTNNLSYMPVFAGGAITITSTPSATHLFIGPDANKWKFIPYGEYDTIQITRPVLAGLTNSPGYALGIGEDGYVTTNISTFNVTDAYVDNLFATNAAFTVSTNVWALNTAFPLATNMQVLVSSTATGGFITTLNHVPAAQFAYNQLMARASGGNITFTNPVGWQANDFAVSRIITNGNSAFINVSAIPGLITNLTIVQYR